MRGVQRISAIIALAVALIVPTIVQASGPADDLLRLVPPDAAATLVVEDFRAHAREVLDSPLVEALRGLPMVKAWLASDRFRQFERSRAEIEQALGVNVVVIRDELAGDAVVLALRAEPEGGPEAARGLLLTRVRDAALLERLIATVNAAETRDGPLSAVVAKSHAGVAYSVREFQPGTKPTEFYALLDSGRTFAWSNSEALLKEAIGRFTARKDASLPASLRATRDALPEGALASLFVDPRLLERTAKPRSKTAKPGEERVAAMLGRYLTALKYAGAALVWRNGLVLHVHESLDPRKVDEPLRRWAAQKAAPILSPRRIPATALAMAAVSVDFVAVVDQILSLVPESDRARADNLMTAVQGILLGKDSRAEILPHLGPGVLAVVDEPKGNEVTPSWLIALTIHDTPDGSPRVADAVQNALRTLLAMSALDKKTPMPPGTRVESRMTAGVSVTTLIGGPSPFAFATAPGVFALGSDPDAVAVFAAAPNGKTESPLEGLRNELVRDASTHFVVDLDRVRQVIGSRFDQVVEHLAKDRKSDDGNPRQDLENMLALASLFRAAYMTSAIPADFSSAHRTIGLVSKQPPVKPHGSR